jgi:hypothetical protein
MSVPSNPKGDDSGAKFLGGNMKRLALLAFVLASCTRTVYLPSEPEPIPSPDPTPVPVAVCSLPTSWSHNYSPKAHPSVMRYAVEAAKVAVGERCGENWQTTLKLLVDWLNANGFCAAVGSEAIFILDDKSDMVEEWHSVYSANGCWTGSNAYKGVHFN